MRGAAAPSQAPAVPERNEPATIVLRLPEGDPAKGETCTRPSSPGQRERVLALIRNQSGIVDNYDLRIEGMPEDWWSIYPGTVYLVPFGSGGTYEQEVEVHLHPPRGPEAEARVWDLQGRRRLQGARTVAARAPLALHIQPYIETTTTLRPQRRKGRRKADFDVTVANKANAPVLVALDGEDPDGELQLRLQPPAAGDPGRAAASSRRCRCGRRSRSGSAARRTAGSRSRRSRARRPRRAPPPSRWAPTCSRRPRRRSRRSGTGAGAPQVPGMYPPRVYKPQLYPPDVNMGPGGINVRMPQFRAPQVQGPQMGSVNAAQLAKPGALKCRAAAAPGTPTAPLMPTQGVFRQRPWLPWWLIPLLVLLLLLLFLLLRSLPQNVVVPKVVGEKSAFDGRGEADRSRPQARPEQEGRRPTTRRRAGSVIAQTPAAGAEAEKGTPVDGPDRRRQRQGRRAQHRRHDGGRGREGAAREELTLGQASPQPLDPEGQDREPDPGRRRDRQGRHAGQHLLSPTRRRARSPATRRRRPATRPAPATSTARQQAAGAGGGARTSSCPAIGKGENVEAYAKRAADLGIVPSRRPSASTTRRPARCSGPSRPAAPKVKNGDEGEAARLRRPAAGRLHQRQEHPAHQRRDGGKLDPVATSPEDEEDPTWTADGTHVAYTADGRVMLKNITKKNSAAVAADARPARSTTNLAWAPTADLNLIAMNDVNATTRRRHRPLPRATSRATTPTSAARPSRRSRSSARSTGRRTARSILGVGVKLPARPGHLRHRALDAEGGQDRVLGRRRRTGTRASS